MKKQHFRKARAYKQEVYVYKNNERQVCMTFPSFTPFWRQL